MQAVYPVIKVRAVPRLNELQTMNSLRTFSSRYQSPGGATILMCCMPIGAIGFHPVIKVRAVSLHIQRYPVFTGGFHPVIKVRAVSLMITELKVPQYRVFIPLSKSGRCHWQPDRHQWRPERFHPVIKVRAVPLYPCSLLLCKRNLGGLRRGEPFLHQSFQKTVKNPYFPL